MSFGCIPLCSVPIVSKLICRMRAQSLSDTFAQVRLALHLLNEFPLNVQVRRLQLLDSMVINALRRALTVELERINCLVVGGERSEPLSLHHYPSY